jgi:hypothetical protein
LVDAFSFRGKQGEFMIRVKMTKNLGGFEIAGDFFDFDELYQAIYNVLGETEHEYEGVEEIRILGLCYDLRHANMGSRDYEYVENAVHEESARYHGMILPPKNIYTSFKTYYPEMVFILLALNEKCREYATRLSKKKFDPYPFDTKEAMWDKSLAIVRTFQSVVFEALSKDLTPSSINRVKKLMSESYYTMENFYTQYLDVQNIKYIEMDREERVKKLTVLFKRFVEPINEYNKLVDEIDDAAEYYNCHPTQIRSGMEYPEDEDILW